MMKRASSQTYDEPDLLTRILRLIVVGFGTPMVLYAVTYLVLLQKQSSFQCGLGGSDEEIRVHYRLGGAVAEELFVPAHPVDRKLRPGYWDPHHARLQYRK